MKTSPVLVGFVLLSSVFAAGAAVADEPGATGSVALSNPRQFADFVAFENGTGKIKYTNFEFASPGTGVWAPGATSTITFNYQSGDYPHTFNLDSITPLSTDSVGFAGTGYFNSDPSYTWNLKGMINEDGVWFQIVYTGTQAGCKLYANGSISATGAMSGTWGGNCWTGINSWSTGPGAAFEVFSYKARLTCAVIDEPGRNATFGYTIPTGVPLAGVPIVVQVHDGGSPHAQQDTWWHGVDAAPGACLATTGAFYPITSGNVVVHRDHDWNDHGRDEDFGRGGWKDDR